MQSVLSEMADEKIKREISDLKGSVEDANDRTLRLGNAVEDLKNFLYRDVNVRLAKVDERASLLLWVAGIAAAAVIAAWIQLLMMNGRLSAIEQQVKDVNGSVQGIRLSQAAADPADPKNIQEARLVLSEAKKTKTAIPATTIRAAGDKFIEVAQNDPQAWSAALAFVDYRSFLNGPNPPPLSAYYPLGMKENPDHVESFQIKLSLPNGAKLPEITSSLSRVNIAVSAHIDQIGNPLPQTAEKGAASLLAVGGALGLSGMSFQHVVLYNVEIHYDGGPVILQDVKFINCRFVMDNVDNGRALSSRILASSAVTFSVPNV
jgi:hypothetical protein